MDNKCLRLFPSSFIPNKKMVDEQNFMSERSKSECFNSDIQTNWKKGQLTTLVRFINLYNTGNVSCAFD